MVNTGDPEHFQLLARAHDNLEFCESIQRVLNGNVAVVDEKSYIDYMVP